MLICPINSLKKQNKKNIKINLWLKSLWSLTWEHNSSLFCYELWMGWRWRWSIKIPSTVETNNSTINELVIAGLTVHLLQYIKFSVQLLLNGQALKHVSYHLRHCLKHIIWLYCARICCWFWLSRIIGCFYQELVKNPTTSLAD